METFIELFDKTAHRLKEKIALLFIRRGKIENRMSYSSLKQISSKVANGLKGMGLESSNLKGKDVSVL